jgi:hypothetical protein
MRLLLALREINWLAVIALIASAVAITVTYVTNPPMLGLTIAVSAIALAQLSGRD